MLSAFASELPSALPEPYRQWWDDSAQLETQGRLEGALVKVRVVRRGQPDFMPALLAEARLLVALGRFESAIGVLEEKPFEPNAMEARSRILLQLERWEEAVVLLDSLQAYGWVNAWFLKARALAPTDATGAAQVLEQALTNVEGVPDPSELALCLLWVGDALIKDGHAERTQSLLHLARPKFDVVPETITELEDRTFIEVQANWLRARPEQSLAAVELDKLAEASRRVSRGDWGGVPSLLDPIVQEHPQHADVRRVQVRYLLGTQQYEEAERVLSLLELLSPLDAAPSLQLAELLKLYFPAYPELAWEAYQRAAKKEPIRPEIWLHKAEMEARLGWVELAQASLEKARSLGGVKQDIVQLSALIESWGRRRGQPLSVEPSDGCSQIEDPSACSHFYRAMAYYYRADAGASDGDWAKALAHLDEGGVGLEAFAPAWNLRGAIYFALGQWDIAGDGLDKAVLAYHKSLEIQPKQPKVLTLMGVIERLKGNSDEALNWWKKAVTYSSGDARDAHYYLADEAAGQWQFWRARNLLKEGFEGEGSYAEHTRALTLKTKIDRSIRLIYGGGLVGGLSISIVLLWFVRRRLTGLTVEEFLDLHPHFHGEMAQICAAIRHEVVKHNTPLLETIPTADERQKEVIRDKLFGERGAVDRFNEYIAALEGVVIKSGLRLNLTRRDPVFRGLISAFSTLERMGPTRIFNESQWSKVARLSKEINVEGFHELGDLIQRVSTTALTGDFVRSVWHRVLAEPVLQDDLREVDFDIVPHDDPVYLRTTHSQLEDILANLLRNAVGHGHASRDTRVRVSWSMYEHPITADRAALIRVADTVTGLITTEMIRSRYVAHGLGLVNQLVEQLQGSVSVESEPGYEKAIVIQIPLEEAP